MIRENSMMLLLFNELQNFAIEFHFGKDWNVSSMKNDNKEKTTFFSYILYKDEIN